MNLILNRSPSETVIYGGMGHRGLFSDRRSRVNLSLDNDIGSLRSPGSRVLDISSASMMSIVHFLQGGEFTLNCPGISDELWRLGVHENYSTE